MKNSKD